MNISLEGTYLEIGIFGMILLTLLEFGFWAWVLFGVKKFAKKVSNFMDGENNE